MTFPPRFLLALLPLLFALVAGCGPAADAGSTGASSRAVTGGETIGGETIGGETIGGDTPAGEAAPLEREYPGRENPENGANSPALGSVPAEEAPGEAEGEGETPTSVAVGETTPPVRPQPSPGERGFGERGGVDPRRPPIDPAAAEPPPPPRFQFFGRDTGGSGNVSFNDLEFDLDLEQGEKFERSMIGEKIEALHGKKIRVAGFMHPASPAQASYFILVKDNQQCCFGPGAYPYHNIRVQMVEGKKARFTTRPVTVEGTFQVEPWIGPDGEVWAVYYLVAESAG